MTVTMNELIDSH